MSAMDIRVLVGHNIARLRKARAMKQEPLSEIAGFSQSYVSQIENGRVNLTLLRLNDLAQAFGVHPSALFAEATVPEDKAGYEPAAPECRLQQEPAIASADHALRRRNQAADGGAQ